MSIERGRTGRHSHMSELVSNGEGRGEAIVLYEGAAPGRADRAQLRQAERLTSRVRPRGLADRLPGEEEGDVVQEGPRLFVLVQSPLPPTETSEHLRGRHLPCSVSLVTSTGHARDLDGLHPDLVTDTRVSEHLSYLKQTSIDRNGLQAVPNLEFDIYHL